MRVLILVVFVVLASLWLYEAFKGAGPAARRRTLYSSITAILLGALAFAVVRFGVHWLTLLAAGALAVLRRVLPWLLRTLPFASRRFDGAAGTPGEQAPPPPRGRPSAMTRKEALDVLGLEEGATREQIHDAYRSLIKKVHPDLPGGSTYLARQVNQAKSVLLGD